MGITLLMWFPYYHCLLTCSETVLLEKSMRRLQLWLAVLAAVVLTGCCSDTPATFGAAASPGSRVYQPPCDGGNYSRPANDPVYTPSTCGPLDPANPRCPLRGLGLPGLDCGDELPPAAPAVPAAPMNTCDPSSLPKNANLGEVYCWVFVQPPAAAPVEVAPARAEWQRVDCPPGPESSDCCWRLVEVPAVFASPPPPPGYWEWRLNPNCKPPPAAPKSGCQSLPEHPIELGVYKIELGKECPGTVCRLP